MLDYSPAIGYADAVKARDPRARTILVSVSMALNGYPVTDRRYANIAVPAVATRSASRDTRALAVLAGPEHVDAITRVPWWLVGLPTDRILMNVAGWHPGNGIVHLTDLGSRSDVPEPVTRMGHAVVRPARHDDVDNFHRDRYGMIDPPMWV